MEFSRRLQKLMFLRVLFVSLLLGASILTQIEEARTYFGGIQSAHYLLIAAIYFLTFLYSLLLKYSKRLTQLAYGQLIADTVVATLIIYTTGGRESIFSFLYLLVIVYSSMLLFRRGSLITSCYKNQNHHQTKKKPNCQIRVFHLIILLSKSWLKL